MRTRAWMAVLSGLCFASVTSVALAANTRPAIVDEVQNPRTIDLVDVYDATPDYLWIVRAEEDSRANKIAINVVAVNNKNTGRLVYVVMQAGEFVKAGITEKGETEEAYLTEGYYATRPFGDGAPPQRENEEQKEYLRRISSKFSDEHAEVLGHFLQMADEQVSMIDALDTGEGPEDFRPGSTPFTSKMAWVLGAPSEPERNSMGYLLRYDGFRRRELPNATMPSLNIPGGRTATTWATLKAGT